MLNEATYRWLLATSLTTLTCGCLVVVGAVSANLARARSLHPAAAAHEPISFDLADVAPPPTALEPEPPPPKPRLAPKVSRSTEPRPSADQPVEREPPPLAQAAALLTQGAPETLDFTDEAFVTGEGSAFAGGVTHRQGASTRAVHGVAFSPGGRGTGQPASRARKVTLDISSLDCPGLTFTNGNEVNGEHVLLRVRVQPDGDVIEVKVIEQSDASLADDVIACAHEWHFHPALNDLGEPIAALSPPLRVRFTR